MPLIWLFVSSTEEFFLPPANGLKGLFVSLEGVCLNIRGESMLYTARSSLSAAVVELILCIIENQSGKEILTL